MTAAHVLDRLATLADPTRSRILLVLERHELTVGELCAVLELPQSTVSRHLRLLSDEGWVVSRQEGTSRFYTVSGGLDEGAIRLWRVVGEDLRDREVAHSDRARTESVLAQRRAKSREFFHASADQWDAMRADLVGERADLLALLGLFDERWVVGDLGCGTGRLAALVAPFVGRVVAVDGSANMLAAARERLAGRENVEFREGDLEALPVEPETLDVAVLSLVLHYAADPLRVLLEARRVLRPGGRLLLVDLLPHDRTEYRQQMGHVWLGFAEPQVRGWLGEAGFGAVRYHLLPADPAARGPGVFATTAVRGAAPAPALRSAEPQR